jgi:hypothetical protein
MAKTLQTYNTYVACTVQHKLEKNYKTHLRTAAGKDGLLY